MLSSVGFNDVNIVPFDWLHPAIPSGMINTVKAVGRVFEAIPLIREFSGSLLISAKRP
jgi:hypothetical protein